MAQAGTKDNPITGPYRATKLVIMFIIKFEIDLAIFNVSLQFLKWTGTLCFVYIYHVYFDTKDYISI